MLNCRCITANPGSFIMRLSPYEIQAIISTFKECFLPGDTIALFGSRVDDSKRGGDIDLFIETHEQDEIKIMNMRSDFSIKLQDKIGDQKIDIVICAEGSKENLPIYYHAKNTGVRLTMNKIILDDDREKKFSQQIYICNIHAERIQEALNYIELLLPLTLEKIENFSINDLGLIELMNSRLSKLQDAMGEHIFPLTLEQLGNLSERQTMIDRLHLLERLQFIESAGFWKNLRDLRNKIVHEYVDVPSLQIGIVHETVKAAKELLAIWRYFLNKLAEHKILPPEYQP